MDIELRLLRSFVMIYERGSLSRAAERLGCTQAAMSMRLKMLETELGAPLFVRAHHKLTPTSKGSELYAKALGLLAAYDEMLSTTRSQVPRQRLRIGLPDDYALGLMSHVLRETTADLEELELEIVCDLSANLAAALQRQDLDLALVTLASPPAQHRLVSERRLFWLQHPAHRVGNPVALAAYPEGCVFRSAMIAALEAAQRPWRVLTQSKGHAGIMASVHAGVAVTAIAEGMAPLGLEQRAETVDLPPLGRVPLYLIGTAKGALVAKLEALLLHQLAG